MIQFNPCEGKNSCRDDGNVCLVCGRTLIEIEATRKLVDDLSELVINLDYENVEEFATYIATRIVKKVNHHRQKETI